MKLLLLFTLLLTTTLQASTLKILNLNMWAVELDLPEFIAKSRSQHIDERIKRLPEEIKDTGADIVVFQEVWKDHRAEQIIEAVKPYGYAYSARKTVSRGWILDGGNGLLIVSRLPLDPKVEAMAFSRGSQFHESILFCRKGAIKTRVQVPEGQWVDLFATHLGAVHVVLKGKKAVEFKASQLEAQLEQTRELIEFINRHRTSGSYLLAADLNTHPFVFEKGTYQGRFSPVYDLLTCAAGAQGCLGLQDSLSPSEDFFTYDTKTNHYARAADFSFEPPGRIDYVFTAGPGLRTRAQALAFVEKPISDHYGLIVTLEWTAPARIPAGK